jgi:hypothetical protein
MREQDRLAVILRCLEERSFREVGALLGVGEEAARKRVDRALEQSTRFFRENGFAVPGIAASTPLFTLAIAAAPSSVARGRGNIGCRLGSGVIGQNGGVNQWTHRTDSPNLWQRLN